MGSMDVMYRAYRNLLDTMKCAKSYLQISEALEASDEGKDRHDGTVSLREIDMDWVEAIEKAIPYIDSAIREQRRFIAQNDEIVAIEKSRKITSESVRHLAQHTNLIAKVEGDTVTPSSILNIYQEESFAIYENRFLRTLIHETQSFVEKKYEALRSLPNESIAAISIDRSFMIRQENIHLELKYSTEYHENMDVDLIKTEIKGLSNYQRVLRIRKILADFMVSPLMQALKNAEAVRPPITRTNLLLKNPNYREALNLWIFLESYEKSGYYASLAKSEGLMDNNMKKGLYDVISLLRFVIRLNLSESVKLELQNNYDEENRRLEEEKAKEEAKRLTDEERRIEEEKEKTRVFYEEVISSLKQEQESRIAELYEKQKREVDELVKESEAKRQLILKENEHKLQQLKEEQESKAKETAIRHQNDLLMLKNEIRMQELCHQDDIKKLNDGFERKIKEIKAENDCALSLKDEENKRIASEFKLHLQELNNQANDKLATLKKQNEELLQTKKNDKHDFILKLNELRSSNNDLQKDNQKLKKQLEKKNLELSISQKRALCKERFCQYQIKMLKTVLKKCMKGAEYEGIIAAIEEVKS